jgi:hypothetical protein
VREALESALAGRSEHRFTRLARLLEPPAEADRQLARSMTEAERGRLQLENLEINEAVASLLKAVDLARGAFLRLAETPGGLARFSELQTDLAFAHHLAGDKKKCEEALATAFAISPKLELDRKRYPPEVLRLFESTRFLLDELGTGSLEVRTFPFGAAVHVNGALVGLGTVRAQSLMAGPNLVSVSQPGYGTVTRVVTVEAGKQARVHVRLSELPGNVAGLLHAAAQEVRSNAAPRWVQQAASRLESELLFIGTLAVSEQVAEVDLHAYDARARRVAARVKSRLALAEAEREGDSLVASLMATLASPRVAAPEATVRRDPWFKRLYRWRYFWPVVGGVLGAAAVGTSVGLGVHYGTRGNDRERRFIALF